MSPTRPCSFSHETGTCPYIIGDAVLYTLPFQHKKTLHTVEYLLLAKEALDGYARWHFQCMQCWMCISDEISRKQLKKIKSCSQFIFLKKIGSNFTSFPSKRNRVRYCEGPNQIIAPVCSVLSFFFRRLIFTWLFPKKETICGKQDFPYRSTWL